MIIPLREGPPIDPLTPFTHCVSTQSDVSPTQMNVTDLKQISYVQSVSSDEKSSDE